MKNCNESSKISHVFFRCCPECQGWIGRHIGVGCEPSTGQQETSGTHPRHKIFGANGNADNRDSEEYHPNDATASEKKSNSDRDSSEETYLILSSEETANEGDSGTDKLSDVDSGTATDSSETAKDGAAEGASKENDDEDENKSDNDSDSTDDTSSVTDNDTVSESANSESDKYDDNMKFESDIDSGGKSPESVIENVSGGEIGVWDLRWMEEEY